MPAIIRGFHHVSMMQATATMHTSEQHQDIGEVQQSPANDQQCTEAKVLERLRAALAEYHLSQVGLDVIMTWLKHSLSQDTDDLERLKLWLTLQVMTPKRRAEKLKEMMSPWQVGCPEVIPRLTRRGVWTQESLPWIAQAEAAYPQIREEVLSLRGKTVFQQYRAPTWAGPRAEDGKGSISHDAGDWNVCYLYLHNIDFTQNRALCPNTIRLIEEVTPRHYHHAFFSVLAPGTHVTKHNGPTNKKLRVHLPLIVPPGQCSLRVGDDVIDVDEGKCIVFDDSFEHEAYNRDPARARVTLIFDVWHPDLSDREVKFFSLLQRSSMRADKRMCELSKEGDGDDFYTLISGAPTFGVSDWDLSDNRSPPTHRQRPEGGL